MCAKIILIEDDKNMADLFQSFLKDENYEIAHYIRGEDGLNALRDCPPDIVLLDLTLPDMAGFDVLRAITEEKISTSVIIVTGHASMNTAVEAMQLGARDFIVKPCTKERMVCTVQNMLEGQQLRHEVQTYKTKIDRKNYCGFIGESLSMQGVYRIIDSAASSKATVFITGESGTGKELCAEAIHKQSGRGDKPFCALNCGAIPRDLMESEVFGHVKGAFTGAHSNREGAASRSHGGTLFLDEICEMDLDLQTKLLRFIQTGRFQKVGGNKEESVDVRFVCATNRDPLEEVNAGRFREDLYYRLHVLPILMPPLRERDDDVGKISDAFLKAFAQEEHKSFTHFSEEVKAVLNGYDWPGNVRQLQNVVRNMIVLNEGEVITIDMLPAPLNQINPDAVPMRSVRSLMPKPIEIQQQGISVIGKNSNDGAAQPCDLIKPMDILEREAIEHAIGVCQGNVPDAAHYLGVSSATIYRKKAAWKAQNKSMIA